MPQLRHKVIALRKQEKTYTEIQKVLGQTIPKSTLSYWCRNIIMTNEFKNRVKQINHTNLKRARIFALQAKKNKKEKYLTSIRRQKSLLKQTLNEKISAKLVLAVLYMCEGSKSNRASLMFGNSDPFIVSLFMRLLRFCYLIDESKFRCTVQCRADQNTKELEIFWSKAANIPLTQFYKARVDPRTIGKPSKKPDYKGVCRIDFFSAKILSELREIISLIK